MEKVECKILVKLWFLRGLKEGILTTRFPESKPTSDEVPSRSIPPKALPSSDWKLGHSVCPTEAIQYTEGTARGEIDLGKCIYCQKCSEAGFVFPSENTSLSLRASTVSDKSEGLTEGQVKKQYDKTRRMFGRSFHVLMIDVGSCNACNMEVLNLGNPYYDLNRLGIFFTNSPKHADALVVVGALNKSMVDVLRRTYENIPSPKVVIAVGACPISGGIFRETKGFASPISDIIPVDVVIPGCPPTPIQILQGLLIAMGKELHSNNSEGLSKVMPRDKEEEIRAKWRST
jgi:formate hydrogenlyase subunit 7